MRRRRSWHEAPGITAGLVLRPAHWRRGRASTKLHVARALDQKRAGTYALTYVANDTTGAAYVSALDDFARCFVSKAPMFVAR